MQIFKVKGMWDGFTKRHPKFPSFLKAMTQGAVTEGSVLEITITTADGRTISSNLKVTAEDVAMVQEMKQMMQEYKK